MVCISPDKPSDRLLRRGWRVSRRLRADLIAVYVACGALTAEQQRILDADFALASRLNIHIEQVPGRDVAQTLADYARKSQVTQIVIGHSARTAWQEAFQGSVINRLIRLVRGIDVLIIANSE